MNPTYETIRMECDDLDGERVHLSRQIAGIDAEREKSYELLETLQIEIVELEGTILAINTQCQTILDDYLQSRREPPLEVKEAQLKAKKRVQSIRVMIKRQKGKVSKVEREVISLSQNKDSMNKKLENVENDLRLKRDALNAITTTTTHDFQQRLRIEQPPLASILRIPGDPVSDGASASEEEELTVTSVVKDAYSPSKKKKVAFKPEIKMADPLPMIVGRKVGSVKGLKLGSVGGRPGYTYDKLALKTKNAITQAATDSLHDMNRDIERDAHEVWKLKQEKIELESELEHFDRMTANLKAKMVAEDATSSLEGVCTALRNFFNSDESLKHVDQRKYGSIHWWASRDREKSIYMEPFEVAEDDDRKRLFNPQTGVPSKRRRSSVIHGAVPLAPDGTEMRVHVSTGNHDVVKKHFNTKAQQLSLEELREIRRNSQLRLAEKHRSRRASAISPTKALPINVNRRLSAPDSPLRTLTPPKPPLPPTKLTNSSPTSSPNKSNNNKKNNKKQSTPPKRLLSEASLVPTIERVPDSCDNSGFIDDSMTQSGMDSFGRIPTNVIIKEEGAPDDSIAPPIEVKLNEVETDSEEEFNFTPRNDSPSPKKKKKRKRRVTITETKKIASEMNLGGNSAQGCLPTADYGVLEGMLTFPIFSLWEIHFLVTKLNELDLTTGDPSDFIIVKFGENPRSLTTFGKYENKKPKGEFGVRHKCTYRFSGRSLCFRFEFHVKSGSREQKLGILPGVFREFEVPDVEYLNEEQTHVITAVVKKIMQQQQNESKNRMAELLEELGNVKTTEEETYDTVVLHGHYQRFKKEHLIKLLEAEVAVENVRAEKAAKSAAELEKRIHAKQKQLLKGPREELTKDQLLAIKMKEAQERYLARKRQKESADMGAAEELVGQTLEIRQHDDTWRMGKVKSFRSKYSEDEARTVIHHLVEYITENGSTHTRWHDFSVTKHVKVDGKARQRSEYIASVEAKMKAEEQQREIAAKQREALRQKRINFMEEQLKLYEEEFETEMESALQKEKNQALSEATKLLDKPEMQQSIKKKAKQVIDDYENGLGPGGGFIRLSLSEATPIAREALIQKTIDRYMRQVKEEWREKSRTHKDEVKERRKHNTESIKQFDAQQEDALAQVEKQKQVSLDAARVELRKHMVIPNFHKAVNQVSNCMHPKTRNWSDKYGHGVKCLLCGAEVSKSQHDVYQIAGGDECLYGAVLWSRQCTGGFPELPDTSKMVGRFKDRISRLPNYKLIEDTPEDSKPPLNPNPNNNSNNKINKLADKRSSTNNRQSGMMPLLHHSSSTGSGINDHTRRRIRPMSNHSISRPGSAIQGSGGVIGSGNRMRSGIRPSSRMRSGGTRSGGSSGGVSETPAEPEPPYRPPLKTIVTGDLPSLTPDLSRSQWSQMVDNERARLEKERREIELTETTFCDLAFPKKMISFNSRHGNPLSSAEVDALPTARRRDIHHRASYQDSISYFLRLTQFRKRLRFLSEENIHWTRVRTGAERRLKYLHSQVELFNEKMRGIDTEFMKTKNMLQQRKDAEEASTICHKMYVNCRNQYRSKVDFQRKQKRMYLEVERELKGMSGVVDGLLRWRRWAESQVKRFTRLKDNTEKQMEKVHQETIINERDLLKTKFCRVGVECNTPYGRGRVVDVRFHDDVIIFEPLWENAPKFTRMYVRGVQIAEIHETRTSEDKERDLMERAEVETRASIKYESDVIARELKNMQREEKAQKEFEDWQIQLQAEAQFIAEEKAKVEAKAKEEVLEEQIQDAFTIRAMEEIKAAVQKRQLEMNAYKVKVQSERQRADKEKRLAKMEAKQKKQDEQELNSDLGAPSEEDDDEFEDDEEDNNNDDDDDEPQEEEQGEEEEEEESEKGKNNGDGEEEDDGDIADDDDNDEASENEEETQEDPADLLGAPEEDNNKTDDKKSKKKKKKNNDDDNENEESDDVDSDDIPDDFDEDMIDFDGEKNLFDDINGIEKIKKEKGPDRLTKFEKIEIRQQAEKRFAEEFIAEKVAEGERRAKMKVQQKRMKGHLGSVIFDLVTKVLDKPLPKIVKEVTKEVFDARKFVEFFTEMRFAVEPNETQEIALPDYELPVHWSLLNGVGNCLAYHRWKTLAETWNEQIAHIQEAVHVLGGAEEDIQERQRKLEEKRIEEAKAMWVKMGRDLKFFNMGAVERMWIDERLRKEREADIAKKTREAMSKDEKELKKFYFEERQACLKERWAMQDEERDTRAFLKQEAALKLQAQLYSTTKDVIDEPVKISAKASRRAEIKQKMAEKQRMNVEIKLMTAEDELSHAVRQEWMDEMNRRRRQAEMGIFEDNESEVDESWSSSSECSDEEIICIPNPPPKLHNEFAYYNQMLEHNSMPIPKERDLMEIEDYRSISHKVSKRRAHYRRKKTRHLIRAMREQQARDIDLDQHCRVVVLRSCRTLLKSYESAEMTRKARGGLAVVLKTRERITMRSLAKQRLEMRMLKNRNIKHEMSVLAEKAVNRTRDKMTELKPKLKVLTQEYHDVLRKTEYFDTTIMSKHYQRFRTRDLHDSLQREWFRHLVLRMVQQAELVATERRAMLSTQKIRVCDRDIQLKTQAMHQLETKRVRHERLKTKRAVLNQKFFKKSRQRTLLKAFHGWFGHIQWLVRLRREFNLKQQVIHQQLLLDDLEETVAEREEMNAHHRLNSAPERPPTLLELHNQRVFLCRHCHEEFTGNTNHSEACAFHPGIYKTACPKSCPVFTTKCMRHYKKRWSCCDSIDKSPFGKGGCERRWHMPPKIDEVYEKQLKEIGDHENAQVENETKLFEHLKKQQLEAQNAGRIALKPTQAYHKKEIEYIEKFNTMFGKEGLKELELEENRF